MFGSKKFRPLGEVTRQHGQNSLSDIDIHPIDAMCTAPVTECFLEFGHALDVRLANFGGMKLELLSRFEVDEACWTVGEGEIHLRAGIEQVEDDHLVLVVAQVLQGADKGLGVFGAIKKVAEDEDERAARAGLGDLVEGVDGTRGT